MLPYFAVLGLEECLVSEVVAFDAVTAEICCPALVAGKCRLVFDFGLVVDFGPVAEHGNRVGWRVVAVELVASVERASEAGAGMSVLTGTAVGTCHIFVGKDAIVMMEAAGMEHVVGYTAVASCASGYYMTVGTAVDRTAGSMPVSMMAVQSSVGGTADT